MIRFKRILSWLTFGFIKIKKPSDEQAEPLREFVYLDEVSLASLLASQTGAITENITSQSVNDSTTEIRGTVSNKSAILPTAEINSRFQTTNSSSLQTTRKANAQSLFRELYRLEELRKIQPVEVVEKASSVEDLYSTKFSGIVCRAAELERGDLVEFNVKLSASWIFQMSTMVAEFSEMFDESPTFFSGRIKFDDLHNAQNANKIISKLLAGLVPVEGIVSDYVVLDNNKEKFIVHSDSIGELNIATHPLRIVGVTEHLAYWKDIRRVLFADNEFTILCRLSKSNLQSDWNPIKVADIFREFAPDLSNQIEISSKAAMKKSSKEKVQNHTDPIAAKMLLALVRYRDNLLEQVNYDFTKEQLSELDLWIADLTIDNVTAEGQRAAFEAVKRKVVGITEQQISSSSDLAARETVRNNFSIPLFPQSTHEEKKAAEIELSEFGEQEKHLLDVEVVAIYW